MVFRHLWCACDICHNYGAGLLCIVIVPVIVSVWSVYVWAAGLWCVRPGEVVINITFESPAGLPRRRGARGGAGPGSDVSLGQSAARSHLLWTNQTAGFTCCPKQPAKTYTQCQARQSQHKCWQWNYNLKLSRVNAKTPVLVRVQHNCDIRIMTLE